ncbi:MAG TPA: Na-translocating system protein MpsC family protein [Solirubrobacteraceae bacterium]|jgi:uncharacterized protein YbcI|nr:Na-translocating system protein MpsC family protein [Solirubrobacteraceae bacterium]
MDHRPAVGPLAVETTRSAACGPGPRAAAERGTSASALRRPPGTGIRLGTTELRRAAGGSNEVGGPPSVDDHVLAAISTRLAEIMNQAYGREPPTVDTYVVDDMLVVVMRDTNLTPLERTLIGTCGPDRVVVLLQDFQRRIAGRYRQAIEELTSRGVLGSTSQAHVEPGLSLMVEIFFLGEHPIAAAAEPA